MRRNVLVLLLATASAASIVFCSPPVRLVAGAESQSRPPFTATVLAILYYWYFLGLIQPTSSGGACTFDATAVSGTFTTDSSRVVLALVEVEFHWIGWCRGIKITSIMSRYLAPYPSEIPLLSNNPICLKDRILQVFNNH